jgi:hypothetical protein
MSETEKRISYLKGSPYEMGYTMGQVLGPKLKTNISEYTNRRVATAPYKRTNASGKASMDWLMSFPRRFQDEFLGLAEGGNLPLQLIADWIYLEPSLDVACTAAICMINGQAWVARNNDMYAPDMWGYITVREPYGKIPWISFCLEGDVFTPTGINREQLWLHYHYLPSLEEDTHEEHSLPPYAFIVDALEVCRSLQDLETLLEDSQLNNAMLLFAVEGKSNTFAIYECDRKNVTKYEPAMDWIAGANHYCGLPDVPLPVDKNFMSSKRRYHRISKLVENLCSIHTPENPVTALMKVLSDDEIEARDNDLATAYSCIACPAALETWYTFGGYPAASHGNWQKFRWPWQ